MDVEEIFLVIPFVDIFTLQNSGCVKKKLHFFADFSHFGCFASHVFIGGMRLKG